MPRDNQKKSCPDVFRREWCTLPAHPILTSLCVSGAKGVHEENKDPLCEQCLAGEFSQFQDDFEPILACNPCKAGDKPVYYDISCRGLLQQARRDITICLRIKCCITWYWNFQKNWQPNSKILWGISEFCRKNVKTLAFCVLHGGLI